MPFLFRPCREFLGCKEPGILTLTRRSKTIVGLSLIERGYKGTEAFLAEIRLTGAHLRPSDARECGDLSG